MEVALKQRLVGASVIIALAVIFIPMLFDNTGAIQNQSITINIPEEPENLQQKVINIDTGHFTSPTNSDEATHNIDESLTENQDDTDDSNVPLINKEETILDVVDNTNDDSKINDKKVDLIDESKQNNDNESQANLTDSASEEIIEPIINDVETNNNEFIRNYRVKFGVFSQQKNAQQLKAKIINSGYTAIVEENSEKNQFTVYSQQFDTESEAENLSEKIQNLNLNIGKPSIISLSQEDSIAADILLDTGWIIQIGSFASKVNSIKLRDKIRNKGFATFVDEITNSKNEKLYRVRIGPYATREEAQNEQDKIKNSMDLKGLIKPHEKQKVVNK